MRFLVDFPFEYWVVRENWNQSKFSIKLCPSFEIYLGFIIIQNHMLLWEFQSVHLILFNLIQFKLIFTPYELIHIRYEDAKKYTKIRKKPILYYCRFAIWARFDHKNGTNDWIWKLCGISTNDEYGLSIKILEFNRRALLKSRLTSR